MKKIVKFENNEWVVQMLKGMYSLNRKINGQIKYQIEQS